MTPGYGHHPLVPTFYEAEPGPADIRLKCLLSWSWSLTELEKCYLSATMSLLVSNDFQPYIVHRYQNIIMKDSPTSFLQKNLFQTCIVSASLVHSRAHHHLHILLMLISWCRVQTDVPDQGWTGIASVFGKDNNKTK